MISLPEPCLYTGHVVHQRLKPKRHRLSYRVFCLLLDLDQLVETCRGLRLLSYNSLNVFSFFDRDHGPRDGTALRPWVVARLRAAGIADDVAHVRLLCYPRLLGYVFNPLSVYFCYRPDGRVAALLYEVHNTFGEAHTYVIGVDDAATGPLRHSCTKAMYVSPFIPMEARYAFSIEPPRDIVKVVINESDADGPLLHASFVGRQAPLSDAMLLRCFFRYPLMTLKVIAGIHWQAFRLWRKGVPLVPRASATTTAAVGSLSPDPSDKGAHVA